jgi:hypothetical protein
MYNNLTPVVLFVYNRPYQTEQVLASLAQNQEAKDTDLIIFSDAPKNPQHETKVKTVRTLIHSFSGFKSISIIETKENKGLSKSIIEGVTQIIEKYGKVIVLEDDCVVSPYFLNYMNDALIYYKDFQNIGSISGYTPPIQIPADYRQDVFFVPRICSMSWATWHDRWQSIDWQCSDFQSKHLNLSFTKAFNQSGTDLFNRLCREIRIGAESWATRFTYNQFIQGYYTVYPKYSYVNNIGHDGSGTHVEITNAFDVSLDKALENSNFALPDIDIRIIRLFCKFYSGRRIGSYKRFLLSLWDIYFRMKK